MLILCSAAYKAGMLTTSMYSAGRVFVATEPDRPSAPDLFFDFRRSGENLTMPHDMVDPNKVLRLLCFAQNFAKTTPNARFAFLRVWSGAHFYPLMLGYDKRECCSFADSLGRCWK